MSGGPPGSQLVAATSRKKGKNKGCAEHATGVDGLAEATSAGRGDTCGNAGAVAKFGLLKNAALQPIDLTEAVRGAQRNVQRAAAEARHAQSPSKRQGNKRPPPPSLFADCFTLLPYPRGLRNSSNFCYINSILQTLIFVPPFAQLALSAAVHAAEVCPTLSALGRWFAQYWKPGLTRQCLVAPQLPFTATTQLSGRLADGTTQQDAQEFLQKMLETINVELCRFEACVLASATPGSHEGRSQANSTATIVTSTSTTGNAAGRGQKKGSSVSLDQVGNGGEERENASSCPSSANTSYMKGMYFARGKARLSVREHVNKEGRSLLLQSIFGGKLESHLKGMSRHKGKTSIVIEHFYSLPVNINFAAECSVEEALLHTCRTEDICDDSRGRELKKTLFVHETPQILLLHLQRWATTAEGECVKLDNRVKFGRRLTIPEAACSDPQLQRNKKQRNYRLLAAVAHRGRATEHGHYVTYLMRHAASIVGIGTAAPHERGTNSATAESLVRHVPDPEFAILCDDTTIRLCPLSAAQSETVYFLVYEKCS